MLLADGAELKLRPKSYAVLRHLVERHGRLVTRDELLEAIWGDVVVTDDAVTQCLTDIRRVLDDSSQSMIRTVPRRGYLFDAPVEEVGADSSANPESPSGRAWKLSAAAVVIVVIAAVASAFVFLSPGAPDAKTSPPSIESSEPAIAVMPFTVLSDDRQQSYFADGVSDEILNLLARQGGLRVIARTSSFSYRGRHVDIATIAEQLGVDYVLEGSLRKAGDNIRINVQLVDAATGEYRWNDTFDGRLSASNIFDIQAQVAAAVADSLEAELPTTAEQRLARMPTANLDALDAYFEGRAKMETRDPDELARASALFERAVALDPEFALAHVALSDSYRLLNNYGSLPFLVAQQRSREAIDAALAIDDDLGEAYASLGNWLKRSGDLRGAERAFLRGIELNPNYAPLYQWYAELLALNEFRAEEAIPYSKMSIALDPRSAIIRSDHARTLAAAGRSAEALSEYDAALAIDPALAAAYVGKALLLQHGFGRIAEAVALLRQAAAINPSSPQPLGLLALAFIDLGETERAVEAIAGAATLAPEHPMPPALAALLHSLRGKVDEAFASATLALERQPGAPWVLLLLRDHYLQRGEPDMALELYDRYYPELLDESLATIGFTAWNLPAAIDLSVVLVEVGRTDRAEALLARCLDHLAGLQGRGAGGYDTADIRIYAVLGDVDAAIDALQDAVEHGWRSGWRYQLDHDLALEGLRGRPEFKALREEILADMERQRRLLDTADEAT